MQSRIEIEPLELRRALDAGEKPLLVDVRQGWEHELVRLGDDTLIPLQELPARAGEVSPAPGQRVICYCHHGVRSLRAVAVLRSAGLEGALSLKGGIDRWAREIDPRLPLY